MTDGSSSVVVRDAVIGALIALGWTTSDEVGQWYVGEFGVETRVDGFRGKLDVGYGVRVNIEAVVGTARCDVRIDATNDFRSSGFRVESTVSWPSIGATRSADALSFGAGVAAWASRAAAAEAALAPLSGLSDEDRKAGLASLQAWLSSASNGETLRNILRSASEAR